MTVLWTLLIVVGAAMIIVAVWPSIRPGKNRTHPAKARAQAEAGGPHRDNADPRRQQGGPPGRQPSGPPPAKGREP